MAIGYNPSAISQGLVLALDAANSKSYPCSGTTWFDMSGNSNNGSLVNAPAFTFSSVYFDGNGDYLSVANNSVFQLGSGNWTIECWIYITSAVNYNGIVSKRVAGTYDAYCIGTDASNNLWITITNTAGTWTLGGVTLATGVTTNTWHHIAVVRNSNTITGYLNGIAGSTPQTFTGSVYDSGQSLYIGSANANGSGQFFNGNISNFRIIKGTALYTSNFTSPSSPLTAISGTSILTCASNTITDGSSNAFAITVAGNSAVSGNSPFRGTTSYSANALAFDGTDDYVTVPDSASTNTFSAITLEMVVKYTSTSNQIFAQKWNYGINAGYGIEIFSSSIYGYAVASPGTYATVSVASYPANRIYHIALTMSGSTQTLYINGTSVASNSGGGFPSFGGYDFRIGGRSNGGGGNDSKFTGTMYYTKIYNQALTLSQIQQNYNALRGRFGI